MTVRLKCLQIQSGRFQGNNMKQLFIKQNHSQKLNLIFLGYGQDGAIFDSLKNRECEDIALVYDYENDDFDISLYREYSSINLIAWSMGVMIAPKVLKQHGILDKVVSSSAINGTLEGIDDNYGIPPKIWDATIDALCESAVLKFYRRMCFDAELYEEFLKHKPQRSVESLKAELIYIRESAKKPSVKNFFYTNAFIGLKDKIIAPANQKKSFSKTETVCQEIECAHYNYELFSKQLL